MFSGWGGNLEYNGKYAAAYTAKRHLQLSCTLLSSYYVALP